VKKFNSPSAKQARMEADYAGKHGLEANEYREIAKDLWRDETERMSLEIEAWQTAADMTGLNAGKIGIFENSGKDYASIKGFDAAAEWVANSFPHALTGKGSIDDRLWEFLKRGKPNLPDPGTAEYHDEIFDRVEARARGAEEFDPGGLDQPTEEFFQPKRPAPVGRPELANPATELPARDLVDKVDEQRKQDGIPNERHDTDVQAEASQRLEADYAGERAKLLGAGKAGGQLGDTETVMAKQIVNREAMAALRSGDKAAIRDAMTLIDAYRRTGTEQGRAFRQRRDPVETPAQRFQRHLIEAILTPPSRQIEKTRGQGEMLGRTKGDIEDDVQKIHDEWLKKFEELKRRLLELGVDLDNLHVLGYDKIRAAQAITIVQTAKADGWDRAYEYWRNSILSGVKTQTANASGNTLHAGWKMFAERAVEAVGNKILQNPTGAQLEEFTYLLAGTMPKLARASQNFLLSFKTELPQLAEQLGRDEASRFDDAEVAIPGTLGKMVRIPQRILLAADEFAKTYIAHAEVGARAFRIAKAEGLEGDAIQDRIAALVGDLESEAWSQAYDFALDATFNQKGSALEKRIKRAAITARADIPGLRYILPFITTPVNIFSTGVKMTPLGSVTLGRRMLQNYRDGKSIFDSNTALAATQFLSWAVMGAKRDSADFRWH
jgi:hypothetical protein